jgi:hypothetical protein
MQTLTIVHHAGVLRTFDSPDASSEVRAEQAGIGGAVGERQDGRQLTCVGARRKRARLQVNSAANLDGVVEG